MDSKNPSAPPGFSALALETSLWPTTSVSDLILGRVNSRSSAPPFSSSWIPGLAPQKTRRIRKMSRQRRGSQAPLKVSKDWGGAMVAVDDMHPDCYIASPDPGWADW